MHVTCFSLQMTFGDAMRNKARLSITGSTGENGRVMTPEFPKAVHAVPYVRPDMGLNVSLTDLSWLMRNFWVPYNGFIIAIFFFLSWHFFCICLVKSKRWKMDSSFCLKCIVTLTRYCSPYNSPPSLGGIASQNKKEKLFLFLWKHHTFLSILVDWTETEKRAWLKANACAYVCVYGCERETDRVCVWVLRARCH